MTGDVIPLDRLDRSHVALAGGKGAALGELSRIEGVRVPPGFCVTTNAFRRAATTASSPLAVPDDLVSAIASHLAALGAGSWAVRSSATAEDLPDASFAGQHDTFLNVATDDVPDAIGRCWASLSTARAVSYRQRNGIDHGSVHMAVVVQEMVPAEAAGVAFTADPVTGNRAVAVVEAVLGLGEALVSGTVDPDRFRVRGDDIVTRAIHEPPALTDEQAVTLAQLARTIAEHFGSPQDVEWCLHDGAFSIVQSRPITTLFPVPAARDDRSRVYVSVGHQQMMTDAMKPLGLSMLQIVSVRPRYEAGSRLFVDVTDMLASAAGRTALFNTLGRSDPLIRDALETLLDRRFLPTPEASSAGPGEGPGSTNGIAWARDGFATTIEELIGQAEADLAAARRTIGAARGDELFDAIATDLGMLSRSLFEPRSMEVLMGAVESTTWLIDHLDEWLGEPGAVDALAQSVAHNVTAAMGLDLLDVADVIRPHPDVVARLRSVTDDHFLDALPALDGGVQAREAITAFLDAYGMRCSGEIDITRPRWREQPSAIVPMLLADIDNFAPGEAPRRHQQGLERARATRARIFERLRDLPDGDTKVAETDLMIRRMRTVSGYREYPKYAWMCRYDVYKQALLEEARRLVDGGVLDHLDDTYFLRFDELRALVHTGRADRELIGRRRAEFAAHERLSPPRVLTSEGEALSGSYRRDDVPDGALVGLAVSSGVVEGRARVVHDIAGAALEPGDILVTAHTDPSWTPLFLTISGLITEVGGLMTHGAVVAREYGLPAVVGVQRATALIEDGRHIRLDGSNGHVVVLDA